MGTAEPQIEAGISYAKVPSDVFQIAMTLSEQQQNVLIGAYVRYFFTGDSGKVPKTLEPYFVMCRGIADRIKDGIHTGGVRNNA